MQELRQAIESIDIKYSTLSEFRAVTSLQSHANFCRIYISKPKPTIG
jgi:hypothetical protein